jgi:hypothetical protein
MARGARSPLVGAAVALLVAGCPKQSPSPPVPRVVDVKVNDHSEGAARVVDAAGLSHRAADGLAARGITIALGAAPVAGVDYRLVVDVEAEIVEGDDRLALRALVEAGLRRVDGAPGEGPIRSRALPEKIVARSELPPAARPAALRAHAERAVDDVMKQLGALARIHLGAPDELVAALGAPDVELRAEAIRAAVERHERAATPALIELLKGDDARLRDQALGALAELGDRRAVKPITEAARFRDVGELPKLIDALAAIGGDEARAWLEFVSAGHDDPEIRDLAREAIGRLERRAAAPPTGERAR